MHSLREELTSRLGQPGLRRYVYGTMDAPGSTLVLLEEPASRSGAVFVHQRTPGPTTGLLSRLERKALERCMTRMLDLRGHGRGDRAHASFAHVEPITDEHEAALRLERLVEAAERRREEVWWHPLNPDAGESALARGRPG
jgi:hypothetical protein